MRLTYKLRTRHANSQKLTKRKKMYVWKYSETDLFIMIYERQKVTNLGRLYWTLRLEIYNNIYITVFILLVENR